MSRTTDLAAALLNAAIDADAVSTQAAADLRQAAADLANIDALDQLDPNSTDAQAVVNLTNSINKKANAIQLAQNRVALITGITSTILTAVGALGAGDIAGGVRGVLQATNALGQL